MCGDGPHGLLLPALKVTLGSPGSGSPGAVEASRNSVDGGFQARTSLRSPKPKLTVLVARAALETVAALSCSPPRGGYATAAGISSSSFARPVDSTSGTALAVAYRQRLTESVPGESPRAPIYELISHCELKNT